MKIMTTSLTVIICLLVGAADAARILAIFPTPVKSHYIVFEPLLRRLSARGHEIISVTHFPQNISLANYTEVDVSSTMPSFNLPLMDTLKFTIPYRIKITDQYGGTPICESLLKHPSVKRIIERKEHFDLFLIEIFVTKCFLGIAHVLNIPKVVALITGTPPPWVNDILKNPENPSYIPNWYTSYTGRMNFLQRSVNAASLVIVKLINRIFWSRSGYDVAKKYLGDDLPDFDVLQSRISLVLMNSHPAVSVARPLMPKCKEIAGIHIPISGPEPLPADLQDYMDSHGRNGVIYFCLGTITDLSDIPSHVFAALYRAFEQVPQQILWKCGKAKMPPLPGNVKCIEWAPQLAVLCHPNTRLFISHGGMLGSQEAIYCGVPILGMPLFGEQFLNIAYYVEKGLALQLDFRQFSYEILSNGLNEMLTNKSYTEMARKASMQFRDRPMPPLEESVYWIEHAIRHDSDFMKTTAEELTWYQYLLLDVLLMVIFVMIFTLWLIRTLFGLLFRKRKKDIGIGKKTK